MDRDRSSGSTSTPKKQAAPYGALDLQFAAAQLLKLGGKDVSPRALEDFKREHSIKLPFIHHHVLRRRDLLELFDTAPDLSGNDIDVSRFVRSDDPETDAQVFWRRWEGTASPPSDLPAPNRRELCSVPAGKDLRAFIEKLSNKRDQLACVWDHIDGQMEIRSVTPDREVRLGLSNTPARHRWRLLEIGLGPRFRGRSPACPT